MKTYVAFLRGINVGGKNIVKMDAVRSAFEELGFSGVKSYIQSGNIIFQSDLSDEEKLAKIISQGLAKIFQLEIKVLIRSQQELEQVVASFPPIFSNPDWKHNIIFLSHKIDSVKILDRFKIKTDLEAIAYCPGVLFWSAKWDGITRSTMLKLSAKPEYQEMTVRNINTTQKIVALMIY